jgi:hypothetical protein
MSEAYDSDNKPLTESDGCISAGGGGESTGIGGGVCNWRNKDDSGCVELVKDEIWGIELKLVFRSPDSCQAEGLFGFSLQSDSL